MMPLDHAAGGNGGDKDDGDHIMCIFIGGPCDGLTVPIKLDADAVQISRPTHLKPLASSNQAEPEAALETGIYNIARLVLPFNDEYVMLGLGVIEGQEPAWAIRELVKAYQRDSYQRLKEENDNG